MKGHASTSRHPRVIEVRDAKQPRVDAMESSVTHAEHGLVFVREGVVTIEYGRPIRAEPGTVVIVPAGVPHRGLGARELWATSVGFCASCFELPETHRLMRPFACVRRGALPAVSIPSKRRRPLLRRFEDLKVEAEHGGPESLELLRAHLALILGEICRAMPGAELESATELRSGDLVSEALDFIQAHALTPISLQEVASAVHRSPAHVTTSVRKATGHSVGSWIAAARVAEATRWLSHTDASLDEIAGAVGWTDKNHLIRQFKKVHGVTPGAWRRGQRG